MDGRLDARDRWLLALTAPLFLCVLAAHVHEVHRTGLAQLPVYAAWHPGDYPRVGGFRLETDSSGSGLRIGDRLIRIGDRDLRGVGYVGFQAIGLARTTPGHPTEIEFERDGVRSVVPLEARPHPVPWSRVPTLLLTAGFSALLLLRAPSRADVRRFYLCFMTYAIAQAHFYGGPEWQTWLAQIVWSIGSVLMVAFLINWVRHFPPELAPEYRIPAWTTWLVAGAYLVFVRANYLLAWPLPIEWVPRVSFAAHGIATVVGLAMLTWNYRSSPPVGQRRLRWILLGTAVGSLPVVLAGLAPTLLPDWDGFRIAFAMGFVSSLIWMVGALIAVLRDNAFDIDRLIGVTAAGTIAIGVGGAGIVVAVPAVSDYLAHDFGIDPTTTRLGLAALVGAAIITLTRRLGPRIESLLFPRQIEQQEAVTRLAESLRSVVSVDVLLAQALEGLRRTFGVDRAATYRRIDGVYVRRSDESGGWPAYVEGPVPKLVTLEPELAPAGLRGASVALCPIADGGDEAPGAFLCLGPMASGESYTPRDRRLLQEVANACEREWLRLQRQSAEAEAVARTNLLAEASHDLRQPLHAVSLLTSALQGRLGDPEVEGIVARISQSTHDLDEMLTLLLDRSRLDAGAVEPRPETIAVSDLFETLDRDFTPPAQASGTRLRFVPTRAMVRTDRLLVLRVLRNLVSNALRYARGGSVLVGVRRTAWPDRLRFEVRDDGPGIDAEHQQAVFGSFVQLPGSTRTGLGLGLSIVDDLVRLLGGRIELVSEAGRGANFRFSVDRASGPALPEAGGGRPGGAPTEGGVVAGSDARRVLIVEDDEAVRESTALLVRSWGFEARAVEGVAAARAAIEEGFPPDVIVSDLHLADGERGLDTIATLRASLAALGRPSPLVVFLTAEKSPDELEAIQATGAHALRKPIRPARLRSLLRSMD